MKSMATTGSFLRTLVLVLLAFVCTGNSFQQELWLYDAQDNALQFHTPVADTSNYTSLLSSVTKVCVRGMWNLFTETNFQAYDRLYGAASVSTIECKAVTSGADIKSFRHLGANDTDTDGLSLYDTTLWTGNEIFVTQRAYTGITTKIIDVAGTGTSDWMLYEGQFLDGRSTCYEVPYSNWHFSFDHLVYFNLTTVGSVFKGCDLQEIQNYKMLHQL